ncbi:MAG: PEP-CTERM sorting domain-containing protein [Phycisphaeraceae bacterium]
MFRLTRSFSIIIVFVVFAAAGSSFASLVDVNGTVTDWGITPFSQTNGQYADSPHQTYSTISNNYSPINYPNVGHLPSPGGSTGELFDLEEMHLRVTAARQLQVLVVTSSPMVAQASGTWYLGDLMLNVNGVRYVVVTQDTSSGGAARGYTAGDVIAAGDASNLLQLQSDDHSYLGNNTLAANDYGPDAKVEDVAGPWQAAAGLTPIASGVIETDTHSYANEADTYLIQYTVNLSDLTNATELGINAHLAWGCGNDVIEVEAANVSNVPEPATMALMSIGGLMCLYPRRK